MNKQNVYSQDDNIKKANINLKVIKDIHNLKQIKQLKSQTKPKKIKLIRRRNININSLIEMEKSKNTKTMQLNKNNVYKKNLSNLKIKAINSKNDNQKMNDENKNIYATLNNDISTKSPENKETKTNKILNGLNKVKLHHKIKSFDTYKIIHNEAHHFNNNKEN